MNKLRLLGLVMTLVFLVSFACSCNGNRGGSSTTQSVSKSTSSKNNVNVNLHITANKYEKRMTDYYSTQTSVLDALALIQITVYQKNTASFNDIKDYVGKQYPDKYVSLNETGELVVGGGGSEEQPLSDNTVKTFMTKYGIRQINADKTSVNFIMKPANPEKVYCSVLYVSNNVVTKSARTMYIKKLADKWYYIQAFAG